MELFISFAFCFFIIR